MGARLQESTRKSSIQRSGSRAKNGLKETHQGVGHHSRGCRIDDSIPLLGRGIRETVRENLGHEDIATTQIYLHLNIRQRSRMYREATRFGV